MAKAKHDSAPLTVPAPRAEPGRSRAIDDSNSDAFNRILANQPVQALWIAHADPQARDQLNSAAIAILFSIAPQDEIEGMLVAQMVAAHSAAMECYRRAMIEQQSLEGRQANLNQGGKLSRTYTQLLDALNRHRGKTAQQKVTVEHVHVHAGGQAMVGTIEAPPGGGGASGENQRQPHASALSHAPVAALRSEDAERELVLRAGDAERPVPHARRNVARRAER